MKHRKVLLACLAVFLLSAALRAAVVWGRGGFWEVGRNEALNISRSLLEKGSFSDAYGPGTGPTAHTTPAFPVLQAVLLAGCKDPRTCAAAAGVLSIAIASLIHGLMPAVAMGFSLGLRRGVIAGVLGAMALTNPWVEGAALENVTAAFCLLLVSAVIWRAVSREGGIGWGGPLACGLALGILGLWSATGFLAAASGFAVLTSLLLQRDRAVRTVLIGAAACAAVMSPWWARNWLVLGKPVLLRSNFWLEAVVSNSPDSGPIGDDQLSKRVYAKYHPIDNPAERTLVRELGEIGYMDAKRRQFLGYAAESPFRIAGLAARRMVRFWFPEARRGIQAAVLWSITLGALGGAFFLWGEKRVLTLWLLSMLLAFSSVHLVVQTMIRYRYTVNWILLLLCSVLIARVWDVAVSAMKPNRSRGGAAETAVPKQEAPTG